MRITGRLNQGHGDRGRPDQGWVVVWFVHFVLGRETPYKEGAPVALGSRGLDILIVLISRPNEVVSKDDLISQVWPGVFVDEGNLRVHIANLRKVLGDGQDGARFIATMPGRGLSLDRAPLTDRRPT